MKKNQFVLRKNGINLFKKWEWKKKIMVGITVQV